MSNHNTPRLDSFRALVQQANSLHADLITIDAAIRVRDGIKQRMSDCDDETEARELLGELAIAEESVTVKHVRQPRLQAQLAELLTTGEKACNAALSEASRIIQSTPQEAVTSFREVLQDALYRGELANRRSAAENLLRAVGPFIMADHLNSNLSSARRSIAPATEPLGERLEGLRSALTNLEKAHAEQANIAAEAARLTAACTAFRKAYSKG